MDNPVLIGSLFSGIGGFELGAEWAFNKENVPNRTLWQVEQDKFCQSILKKHWPNAQIFDDVRTVGAHNLPKVDILMGGFPCQDISVAGLKKGVENGEKSILWFEMFRVIGELKPRYVVIENVPNIIRLGGVRVVSDLASIGYSTEWSIISAKQFRLPHLRRRWFCIATDTNSQHMQEQPINTQPMEKTRLFKRRSGKVNRKERSNRWSQIPTQSPLCSMDDGIPRRVARLKALGNAIVPQCSEWVFQKLITSNDFKQWRQQWKK